MAIFASCQYLLVASSFLQLFLVAGFHLRVYRNLVLRKDDLQEKALSAVTSILRCSKGDARNLLMHCRWDTESLFGNDRLYFCQSWHLCNSAFHHYQYLKANPKYHF